MEGITIDQMTHDEALVCLDWARAEGWNPGLHDADVFYGSGPEGFFAAHCQGEMVGCISVATYPDQFRFGGLLIVKPEYRNKGVGKLLISLMLRISQDGNLGCDGVLPMVKKYESYGFIPSYENVRYAGRSVLGRGAGEDMVPVSSVPFPKLVGYDAGVFSSERKRFLELWISQPDSFGLVRRSEDRIRGYGLIRRCHAGHKVGPLFADDEVVAADILSSLVSRFPGEDFSLDVPSSNRRGVDLARHFGMRPVFSTMRMYTRGPPNIDIDRLFGITSFELG
jgi:GNAT superfamily N-acetyltransferase